MTVPPPVAPTVESETKVNEPMGKPFGQSVAEAVDLVRDHPGVEHIWLNALHCIRPTDEFAAKVGREVIAKVMAQSDNSLDYSRHIVLRINAS